LADLGTGRVVGRGVARAQASGVKVTPIAFFDESPAWVSDDQAIHSYLETCEAKIGEPVDPAYLKGVLTSATIADAVEAYDAGRYSEALDLYQTALHLPQGDQLRTRNGIYLASTALGHAGEAE